MKSKGLFLFFSFLTLKLAEIYENQQILVIFVDFHKSFHINKFPSYKEIK